jgi:hypothetical protein
VLAGSVGAAADGTAWRLSAVRSPGSAAPAPVGAPVPASAPAPAPR